VGRLVPAEEDPGREASERELRERREREEERRAEAEELGAEGDEQTSVSPHALVHGPWKRTEGRSRFPLVFLFSRSCVVS